MGYDNMKIVSMNLTKAGRKNESYLRQLLDGEQPDLCLLPGDNDDMKKTMVCGYEQYLNQGNDQTVLLYNPKRLKLKWSPVSVNQYPQLPGINFDSLVCPEAEVELGPYKEPRRFSVLTWHFELTQNGIDRRTQAENIIRLSQSIAMTRQIPIFIGGDFNIDLNSIQNIVKKLSSDCKQALNENATNSGFYPKNVWLPSMVSGSLWEQKHLISMNVHTCKQNPSVVATYSSQQQSDFFVASKALMLEETSLVDLGCATGKRAKVERCEVEQSPQIGNGSSCYTPTKTTMKTQPRPPKHSGG